VVVRQSVGWLVGVKVYASDENLEREFELARISAEE
jgi:hypothetical protein